MNVFSRFREDIATGRQSDMVFFFKMVSIEAFGDDLLLGICVFSIVLVVLISWLSTNVRDFSVPTQLLVVERGNRRKYIIFFC